MDEEFLNDPVAIMRHEKQITEAVIKQSDSDFMFFVKSLLIPGQTGPKPMLDIMADFQRICFEDLGPSLHALREGETPPTQRFWIERTKKASKDADLAIVALWLLIFPKRPFYMQIGAGTGEQASIVKSRIEHLLHFNPWMNDYVELIQNEVRSKKTQMNGKPLARMHIMTTNVNASHGGIPDLLIINELSHIDKWQFADTLMDNADGVAQGVAIIATNAGFKGTTAEVWRNNAIGSDFWSVHILDRPAPWHSAKNIADAAKRNTKSRHNRLWYGKWVSGKGDALDENDIDRCFRLSGPRAPDPAMWYVKGLDLGISHDHSAVVVLEVNHRTRKIRTAFWKEWEPDPKTGEVNLQVVEDSIVALNTKYPGKLYYDPTEARLMMQRVSGQIPVEKMSFASPKNLNLMAETLIQVVENGQLECYDNEDGSLRRDFGKFNIVEKTYGYKLEAVSDEFGHADVGTALVIALPAAADMLASGTGLMADDPMVYEEEERLTEDEIDNLPAEFKDMWDIEAEHIDPEDMRYGFDSLFDEEI